MEVQRRTVVVIDNLVKLVRDPQVAAIYLSPLVEGVQRIAKGAAFPEVRAFGETALETLLKSGASATGTPPPLRNIDAEAVETYFALTNMLPTELLITSPATPNGPHSPRHPLLSTTLRCQARLVADLVVARAFQDESKWKRCVGVYMKPWLQEEGAEAYALAVRSHFQAIDNAKNKVVASTSDEEGEVLCDTLFSLAYGALLLLSHTTLRLIRGRRYGILGTNGSGKSTLMRQLRDGKVENFPPQSELRCIMVEHSLQGEDASLSILDFIASGSAIFLLRPWGPPCLPLILALKTRLSRTFPEPRSATN
jgi:elongation factor 3